MRFYETSINQSVALKSGDGFAANQHNQVRDEVKLWAWQLLKRRAKKGSSSLTKNNVLLLVSQDTGLLVIF